MTLIAKIIKFLTQFAAIIAAVEAVIRLARFAWNLILKLIKGRAMAGNFAPMAGRFVRMATVRC